MKYILIITVILFATDTDRGTVGGAIDIATVAFADQAACDYAASRVAGLRRPGQSVPGDAFPGYGHYRSEAICVPISVPTKPPRTPFFERPPRQ